MHLAITAASPPRSCSISRLALVISGFSCHKGASLNITDQQPATDPLCAVQAGVNAEALSYEDYLNAPGETVMRTFKTPGSYSFYCEPHQGAGMQGKIIVK